MKPTEIKKQNTASFSPVDVAEIISLIKNILASLDVKFDAIEITEDATTNKKTFVIRTQEPELLIGENGETLHALTHILRRMIQKGPEEMVDFSLDINDYKSGMIEKLKIKAGMLAERARSMKANVEMDPMSSYERLIIHGALSNEHNIKTESIGEGKDRRIVIKYIETII